MAITRPDRYTHQNSAEPIAWSEDVRGGRLYVESRAELYALASVPNKLKEGVTIVRVKSDSDNGGAPSELLLTDATKIGLAAGWSPYGTSGGVSGPIGDALQSALDPSGDNAFLTQTGAREFLEDELLTSSLQFARKQAFDELEAGSPRTGIFDAYYLGIDGKYRWWRMGIDEQQQLTLAAMRQDTNPPTQVLEASIAFTRAGQIVVNGTPLGGATAPVDFRIAFQPGTLTYPLPAGTTAVFGVVADDNQNLFRLRGDFSLDVDAGTITFPQSVLDPLALGDYIYGTAWTGVGAGNGTPGYVQDGYVESGYVS